MGEFALLSFMIFFPAFGALLLLLVKKLTATTDGDSASEERIAYMSGILISAATFVLSLIALAFFNADDSSFQLVEDIHWFGGTLQDDGSVTGGNSPCPASGGSVGGAGGRSPVPVPLPAVAFPASAIAAMIRGANGTASKLGINAGCTERLDVAVQSLAVMWCSLQ